VVRSAVRSEPAPGSVRANALSRDAAGQSGRNRCFCSGVPNVRTGSTAPMQPWTEARPATVGIDGRHLRQERGERGERRAAAAVLASTKRPQ
jgi:hypothetical protein